MQLKITNMTIEYEGKILVPNWNRVQNEFGIKALLNLAAMVSEYEGRVANFEMSVFSKYGPLFLALAEASPGGIYWKEQSKTVKLNSTTP